MTRLCYSRRGRDGAVFSVGRHCRQCIVYILNELETPSNPVRNLPL